MELGEGTLQVWQVMKHRVPEHEIEALVREGQRLGVGPGRSHRHAKAVGVGGERSHHPGRDVSARRLPYDAGLKQVEREVAGPGADLQRARIAPVKLGAEELSELAQDLALADLAEVDSPLGVVAR